MKILCTKDFFMETGEIAFKAGTTYKFKTCGINEWVGESEVDMIHYMGNDDLIKLNPLIGIECFGCYSFNRDLERLKQYRCSVKGSCPAFEVE